MATLKFCDVDKVYDNNVQAVYSFSLDINDKEFVVFVGPSGCGKSTTLRMVAGLEDITAGELYIDGVLVNDILPKDRDIAMVFQNYALYPHITVFDNMAFGLRLRKFVGPAKAEKLIECEEYLALLNREEEVLAALALPCKKRGERAGLIANELHSNRFLARRLINAKLSSHSDFEAEKTKAEEERKAILTQYESKGLGVNEQKQLYRLSDNEVITKKQKYSAYEIDSKVRAASDILGLNEYLDRLPKALSGGQRQRVALGRAIVRQPKVFLMDEPLSNLDAKLRVQTRSEITRIHKRVGATTIYVTHDQTEAMTMADRIVVMKDGRIQQIGTPSEVYDSPSNMFVAGFIGTPPMNFLRGNLLEDGFLLDGEAKIAIPLSKKRIEAISSYIGKPLVLGIRPEDLSISRGGFPTKTEVVELLGSELIVYGNVDSQRIVIKIKERLQISEGQELALSIDEAHCHFFDPESSERIG